MRQTATQLPTHPLILEALPQAGTQKSMMTLTRGGFDMLGSGRHKIESEDGLYCSSASQSQGQSHDALQRSSSKTR